MAYESLGIVGQALHRLFSNAGLTIADGSDLHLTIESASQLSLWWSNGRQGSLGTDVLPKSLCCLRLASGALFLDPHNHRRVLRDLAQGPMMYWNNVQSKAKDTEWEVNSWAHFRQAGFEPFFSEPDLRMHIDGEQFGIACKKLYSLENTDKQISRGVEQIQESRCSGLLSLSLDCLVQPDVNVAMLKVRTEAEAREVLQEKLRIFTELKRERIQKRYFSSGRLSGIVLSVQAFADIEETKERAIHCQETLVWTDGIVAQPKKDKMHFLHEKLKGAMISFEQVLSRAQALLA